MLKKSVGKGISFLSKHIPLSPNQLHVQRLFFTQICPFQI